MSGTVQVRMRHEFDLRPGCVLTDWPVSGLDELINEVKRWGLVADGADAGETLFGQFVIAETAAYFEIVVVAAD